MNKKKKLLIVSHDESIRGFISEILRYNPEYEIITAEDGAKGMKRAVREAPDLVILDIMMPEIDGYHVCKMLKSNVERYIPIIMLAHQGFINSDQNLPADEILLTPFDPMALISRVEAVLRKSKSHCATNPFIQLSGHINIGRELTKYTQFSIGYADLDNLKAFNEQYGSTKGDQLIGHTKRIISNSVKTFGTPHDFVKHISGDDFVFVTIPERVEPICHSIIETFNREIPIYYGNDFRIEETMISRIQHEKCKRFSTVSISIAVVTNLHRNFTDFAEIGEIAAEVRRYLKTLPGSNYYINRRSNGYISR